MPKGPRRTSRKAVRSVPALGFEPLDAQHSLLVELTAWLEKAIADGTAESMLSDWMSRVWAYMAMHFAFEERLMTQNDYPSLAGHRRAHDEALDIMRNLELACAQGTPGTSLRALQFAKGWEQQHINGPDRHLAGFLKDHKVGDLPSSTKLSCSQNSSTVPRKHS